MIGKDLDDQLIYRHNMDFSARPTYIVMPAPFTLFP